MKRLILSVIVVSVLLLPACSTPTTTTTEPDELTYTWEFDDGGSGDDPTTTTTTTTPTTTSPTTTTTTTTSPTTTPTTTTPTTTTPTTTTPTTTEPDTRGELPTTYKYTIAFSSIDGGSGTYEIWVKGEKLRLEMTAEEQGETTTMIVLISEDYDYLYMPEENMAIRYPSESSMSPAAAFYSFALFFTGYYTVYFLDEMILAEWEAACSADPYCQSVQITGHETISGEACTVFETTYTDGSKAKVWLATNKGYVMKVENITAEVTMTIEFIDIDLNPTIPDSMFELPEGVEIMDAPGIDLTP